MAQAPSQQPLRGSSHPGFAVASKLLAGLMVVGAIAWFDESVLFFLLAYDDVSLLQQRRAQAVKDTIKRRGVPAVQEAGNNALPALHVERPDAVATLQYIVQRPGTMRMLAAPKGEGTSTLMAAFARDNPYVIRADLDSGDFDSAVRAVAAALGYSMSYTAAEARARKAGCMLPDFTKKQGMEEFIDLLLVFEEACRELHAEGALGGRMPILILDHADCPKPGPSDQPTDCFVYMTLEIGKRISNDGLASLVVVVADPKPEGEAWRTSGGRDCVHHVRVPPLTVEEARQLLARRIFANATERTAPPGSTSSAPPTQQQLADIEAQYAATLAFVTGAVGTRAAWMMQVLPLGEVPLPDAELAASGVAVDPFLYPFLPEVLRDPGLRVDPTVHAFVCTLVSACCEALAPFLEVPHSFELPPSPAAKPDAETVASHLLAVDFALRRLLHAEAARATVSHPVWHAGVTCVDLPSRHVTARHDYLNALCAARVLFYNHGSCVLEFESELMHRVVAHAMQTQRHKDSVALVNKLHQLQEAVETEKRQTRLYRLYAKVADLLSDPTANYGSAEKACKATEHTAHRLERDIQVLRHRLAGRDNEKQQQGAAVE